MSNFVFISPNFPNNYWHFCQELKKNGMTVLGIGDCPYFELAEELRNSLTDYYKVTSLENYEEVYRAVAFFIHKYGRIDWLESNNEYWLEKDAHLRTEYGIKTGFHDEDMPHVKFKSLMKENYTKAGIPVARYHLVDNITNCRKFIKEVGYPVVIKPDNGVGAGDTHKIKNDADLKAFMATKGDEQYIMEEFITGEVHSYDAIVDSNGDPIFETGNVTLVNLMDIVNNSDNCALYIRATLPKKLIKAGRATVKAFGIKSRMVHLEFFYLTEDQYLGKKGDYVALEVNMRPSGGISPTMMNYANGTDVYKIWADMVTYDKTDKTSVDDMICIYVGRRDNKNFVMSDYDIHEKYGSHIREEGPVDGALRMTMADYMYLATFETEEETVEFVKSLCETVEE